MKAIFRMALGMGLAVGLAGVVTGCASVNSTSATSSAGPTTVTVSFAGALPTAVATKIGSGAFTAATLDGATVSLELPSGTTDFAVAYVCPVETYYTGGSGSSGTISNSYPSTSIATRSELSRAGQIAARQNGSLLRPRLKPLDSVDGFFSQTTQVVLEASTLDGSSFTTSCDNSGGVSISNNALTGQIDLSSVPGFEELDAMGVDQSTGAYSYYQGVSVYADGSFTLGPPTGSDRIILTVETMEGDGADYVKSLSGQTAPGALNGGNAVVFSAADAVSHQPIRYSLPAGCSTPSTTEYLAPAGTQGEIWLSSAAAQYPVLPAPAREAGDYTLLESNVAGCNLVMTVETSSTTGGPITVSFPAVWNYAGPTAAALPTFANLGYTGFSGSGAQAVTVETDWTISSSGDSYATIVTATRNWMNGSNAISFPDPSGVAGFFAPPPSGQSVEWRATQLQSSYGFLQPTAANGTLTTVGSSGGYVVP
jgi:hypothetical protein